jgi:hypothetical protein
LKWQFFKGVSLILFGSLLNHGQLAETGNDSALHLAVFVQGRVSLKRPGWSGYAPVVFGTYLRLGDLLRLDESSHAKVVCSDLSLHDVPAGIVGVPCEGARPVLRRSDESLINPTRGWEGYGSFPLVLSPRKTKLLSPHPVLRWTPVEGASGYLIAIRGPNGVWTAEVGSATKFIYPETAPKLKAGVDYKLIVETDSESSASEPGFGLGFSMLGSEDSKAVEKEQRKIENLGLPAGPSQFLVAHFYATRGLNAEAIQRLEEVSGTFNTSAVARLLGDLYLTVGLTRQAEVDYLNSLNLSKNEEDTEGQMLAHTSLARIYEALGNVRLAIQHLDAALATAKKLGDKQRTEQMSNELKQLQR